ncbi:LysR family transcriptional regulator [Vibrio sp. CAU 1672]|uniref:LysR family transcriptional regulator n=1 Tax=Vibrio sp. CAU 1672 TaxID=3032594 RepID=UPI0023DC8183|nr:LysR family transcriptional regulator [Vibrio sp. CAU 1672]MDF2153827.1 LysR family transcriptional regulator [Vibrio sp. CAU 1672]
MELKQLLHFATVVETGTISAAARRLNLAQPAISTSIKKLEAELKTQLFHRRDKGVSLTEAGQQFLQHARQILQQTNDAKLAMQAIEGLDQGEVQIGLPSMMGSYFFPPILMAFRHQYPGLSLDIIDAGTRSIRQQLLDGELELGVVADKDLVPELSSEELIQEEMVVCMASDHPLAEKPLIEYRDFLAHDLVLFQKGYYFHTLIEKISREEQMRPNVAFSSNLLPLIKSVIRQGFAISPMWKVAIQDNDGIVTRPFAEPFCIDLSLAWRRDSYLSRANQVFRDFVLEHVKRQQGRL